MVKETAKKNQAPGRPRKKNADYFPHYAKNGRTKKVLRQAMGHTGTSMWWELLELLTSAENHTFFANTEINWLYLLDALFCDEETAIRFLNLLADLGKIDQKLWETKIIWCQSLVDKLAATLYYKRSTKAPHKPSLSNFRTKKGGFRAKTPKQEPLNGNFRTKKVHSKGQDSTVKKSKGQETISAEFDPKTFLFPLSFEGHFDAVLYALNKYDTSTHGNAKNARIKKAQSLSDRFEPAYIIEKLMHFFWVLKYRRELAGEKPTGYLVNSIEKQWAPPAGYEEWCEKELKASRIRKQITESINS